MLIQRGIAESLSGIFQQLGLIGQDETSSKDKAAKIGQILSFLEIIHPLVRKYSNKRELVFIDCGAGNCYLSFVLYYFYTILNDRRIQIHCVDNNQRLMEKNRQLSRELGFENMFFYPCDISNFSFDLRPDFVYTLHSCGSATDKALFLGMKTDARTILSVSCCQPASIDKSTRNPFSGLTRHSIFKEKLVYMVGDSLRALLLEMQGYEVDIFQYASSRYSDKNIMLRAKKGGAKNPDSLREQYRLLTKTFNFAPALEQYLNQIES